MNFTQDILTTTTNFVFKIFSYSPFLPPFANLTTSRHLSARYCSGICTPVCDYLDSSIFHSSKAGHPHFEHPFIWIGPTRFNGVIDLVLKSLYYSQIKHNLNKFIAILFSLMI
jgi:hypothetical protein